MNLMMLLEMATQGCGDRIAVQCGDDKLSYAELFAAAGRAGHAAKQSGCERVGVLDESSPALPVALFGAAWAGIPFVPLNYRLTGDELERLLERITPYTLITDEERAASLSGRTGGNAEARTSFLESALGSGESLPEGEWSMDAEDIAILLFTSGTTGAPKAAVIRHKHLVSYVLGSVEFMGAAEEDAALVCVPPYHIAGMAALCSSIYSGRRIVQLPSFTAEAWLEAAESEKVTHAFVVPTMLSRIIDVVTAQGDSAKALPHLRALSYGGGKMPLPVIERAMTLFPNADFTNAYGLTETSSTIAVLGPDDHRSAASSEDAAVRARLTSVGQPLPTVEVEIRDPDGKACPADEPGEIYVRGEQVSGEYLGRGSLLNAEGWFPTNDGGWLDSEGYLFVTGRIDDVIVRGGENMSPGEIEDVLLDHDAVRDVAVVGIPDEQWGEAVAAAVVLHEGASPGADVLQAFVKERLRSSRVPQLLVFRDELPYNETGKLLRRLVKADLESISGS